MTIGFKKKFKKRMNYMKKGILHEFSIKKENDFLKKIFCWLLIRKEEMASHHFPLVTLSLTCCMLIVQLDTPIEK